MTYLLLALVISLFGGTLVFRRLSRRHRGDALFYALGSAALTFAVTAGAAQLVWVIVRIPMGGDSSAREITLNLTTLVVGGLMLVGTAVITAGATLAGVRVGRELATQDPREADAPARLPETVAGVSLARLRQALTDQLDPDELHNLAFDLGVDLDSLGGTGKSGQIRELLEHLYRRGDLERLVALVRERRPDIQL